ncbi:MAG: GAF domain-containing protein [Candidatus Cloacimonadota bacterium]|nr:MAG: GAF domain-containing protein [Candidatus Cloacimonadota bacterium]
MSNNFENPISQYKAGEARKLPVFLEEILEEIQEKVECEAGSIMLFEDETQELVFKVTAGAKSSEIKKLSVNINEGIVGWVFRKGEPLLANDTIRDKRFCNKFDKSTGFTTKSIIAVPLKLGDRVVGVMELLNKKKGNFNQKDFNIVLSYASLTSVVIENIELYKHLRNLVNRVKNLENYQKVLLESLTDGIISINSKKKIVSCNTSIQVILNRDKDSIIGKSISVFFDSKESIKTIITGCRKRGKIKDLFCYLKIDKNKRIPVAIDASLLHDDSKNKGIVIVVKNLKSALNQEELKRETILRSDLVFNLSHEFNTPMTVIQAGIQIIKRNLNENENNKYIEIIDSNVEILRERIQTFLDYLKAEKDQWKVRLRRIRLDSILNQVIEGFNNRFPEYKFILSLPSSPIYIYADKEQIEKVLGMILKNAIQYSEAGSKIKARITLNNKFINLDVEDNGRGICSKNLEYIFDKFKRFSDPLKETSSGLGIGLWLAKYLLKMNNANIKIKSKENKGTIVRLSFKKYRVNP